MVARILGYQKVRVSARPKLRTRIVSMRERRALEDHDVDSSVGKCFEHDTKLSRS
jgi:hypothetical protein